MLTISGGLVGAGYEGRSLEQFIDELNAQEVRAVVDVRLNAISRKVGFSKRALSSNLSLAGIDYMHLPALGNPRDNRAGFSGDWQELEQARSTYREILGERHSIEALSLVIDIMTKGTVALMCFEANQERCHRQVTIQEIIETQSRRSG
ncbi:DUF488 domain-containing protein [Pseudonocardia sp. Ae717_Ps2]|uniref:DUF488 domain-containing protein n=1 Tax=Pseudonocardia sp. Ae717_Ps2 TaxID=1885573 RepID=UPI0009FA376E